MRILRNILILIILTYGLAMGYLWYQTRQGLESISQAASGFAQISYDSFFVSPLGNEISVNNIDINPRATPDVFRIEKLRLFADRPGFFLIAGNSLQAGKLPAKIDMGITGLRFSLDSKLFSMLEEMANQAQDAQAQQSAFSFTHLNALGCGDISEFQLIDYRLMGVNSITSDVNMHLQFNELANMLNLKLDVITSGLNNISINTEIKVPNDDMQGVTRTNYIPSMRIETNDTGYHKLRNTYCANSNKGTVEEYVDKHVELLRKELGFNLPQNALDAYRQYMLTGGIFNISLKPKSDVKPASLEYYQPLGVADLLGLKLVIGKTRITINQIMDVNAPLLEKAATQKAEKRAEAKAAEQAQIEKKKRAEASRSIKPSYHSAKIDNAEKHVGKMVEVTLPGNKVRKGVLDKVSDERIYLNMQVHGGTLTYPVKINEISKFRVLY